MKIHAILFLTFSLLLVACQPNEISEPKSIDLSGEWEVALDSLNQGEQEAWINSLPGEMTMRLPATLDEAGIGNPSTLQPALNNEVLSHLTRKHEYIGKAWYTRSFTLPEDWAGGTYELNLERVIWESKVWINGQLLGTDNSLVAPHRYLVSDQLQAGENQITIRVDNGDLYPNINVTSDRYPVVVSQEMCHAYTNHTQIKWNGILGDISLREKFTDAIDVLTVATDQGTGNMTLSFTGEQADNATFNYSLALNDEAVQGGEVTFTASGGQMKAELSLEGSPALWDEYTPNLYTLTLSRENQALASATFGYTEVGTKEGQLTLNGTRIYLRGTLECSIFPLTGRPPLEKSAWIDLYQKAKAYGLNHFRFHSWCPPKAAFEAADEIGFYLQAELPHWSLVVGADSTANAYLAQEADRILMEYGNHPSFILMSMGNELEGGFEFLNNFTAGLKARDSRRLYSTTTFSFQQGAGALPQAEDEFFVTQWTEKGWVRGQGIFNARAPHFDKDYRAEIDHITQPLISHEIGQYSVYPDVDEIDRYTGVLDPLNFKAIRQDLDKKGLLPLAPDFTRSSVALANILYKEEIERALKTPGFDGFQLLQLQDFPGQGTALVGLLNAFWEPKGEINGTDFSKFCGPMVPLLRFPKAIYTAGETFTAEIQMANFLRPMEDLTLNWSIQNGDDIISEGAIEAVDLQIGNENFVGKFSAELSTQEAAEMTVNVSVAGTDYENSWSVWVYPASEVAQPEGLVYTRNFAEASVALAAGKKVLLNPDFAALTGVTGRFVPVFWSPVHFPDQPATMGILCQPEHPAFADFPTQEHTNWQWWDLNIQSKALVLDELGVDPLVRVVDNFVTNRSLGSVFEAKVGEGSLLFTSIDLDTDLENRHVARQFRNSLANYMNSDDFSPEKSIEFKDLLNFRLTK